MDPTAYYVQTTRRLAAGQNLWAIFVHAAIFVSVLPSWAHAALVAASFAVLTPFNLLTSRFLAPRLRPAFVEGFRYVVNDAACVYVYHVIGWPPAAFMWLPFAALATGSGSNRLAYGLLAFHALAYSVAPWLDGISWLVPLGWVGTALVCRVSIDQREALTKDVLRGSEEQRLSAEDANARMAQEIEARERAEAELREAQKLEAIGRLASGIAHEINNPLQFVDNSAELIAESVTELLERVDRWRRKVDDPRIPEHVRAELDHVERQWDLPVLRSDVRESLTAMRVGIRRVTEIVRAMRVFAQPEPAAKQLADVNRTVETTLAIARHEYANVAQVTTKLGTLPRVVCQPAAISQVLLCLVVNAAQAVSDSRSADRGRITVKSWAEPGWVMVSVHDTGPSIPEGDRDRVFEPFYARGVVTKAPAVGLGVARAIAEGHGGRLDVVSAPVEGTTFTLRLPISLPVEEAA